MEKTEQTNVRLPSELKHWLKEQQLRNRSSLSSEVVRSIRERKDRVEQQKKEAA